LSAVPRGRAALLCALIASAVGIAGAGASGRTAAASARPAAKIAVPNDFLGIVSDNVFALTPYWKAQTLATERRSGVELLRQTFDWATIEPRPGVYHFAAYDALMSATARAGVQVLAVLDLTPTWAAASPRRGQDASASTVFPPRSMSTFAQFCALVVRRYGPGGSFWKAHPKLPQVPIRLWQVWNEPNFQIYWGGHPSAAAYATMLRAAYPAIHAADPSGDVLTGGLAATTGGGVEFQPYLDALLRVRPRVPFDTLAIHVYDPNADEVVAGVRYARQLLSAGGRSTTPLWLTEFGWASAGPPSVFTVGPKRQAAYVLSAIVALARDARALKLRGIVYYDWMDEPPYRGRSDYWGYHTGLVTIKEVAKPALSTYYQAAGLLGALP
jgi:hypothetical protein